MRQTKIFMYINRMLGYERHVIARIADLIRGLVSGRQHDRFIQRLADASRFRHAFESFHRDFVGNHDLPGVLIVEH
jgi:hypothetical protein